MGLGAFSYLVNGGRLAAYKNGAFFFVGFASCFSLVFNSFLELAVRSRRHKNKKTWRVLAYGRALPKKPGNLVNKITSPIT